jgi:hypothetical protein
MSSTVKVLLVLSVFASMGWGFFGHETINRLSVFSLPPEMITFYKRHIDYLVEASVNPDKRRYAVKEEAPRHYIDLDSYGDSARNLPKYWNAAVARIGEDSLMKHGIVPWHIAFMTEKLREAFFIRDPDRILRLSAELAHYVADANVPLHTTRNHNGQLTNQHGIHGFWESRLPELFYRQYNFYVGKATYEPDVSRRAWEAVFRAHAAVDSVLTEDRILSINHSSKKYNYETRGKQTIRVFSEDYSRLYHQRLHGMVERQMRASIRMTADLWFTAWVDAGQPDLRGLIDYRPTAEELRKRKEEWDGWKLRNYSAREHETGDN